MEKVWRGIIVWTSFCLPNSWTNLIVSFFKSLRRYESWIGKCNCNDRWKCSDDNCAFRSTRYAAMCATWWKVFYRKFVYFLNVWREFPLGRPTMKWLYHWLSSSTRDISTFRISLFSSPFTIYLLSSDLYPPLVINREKSDTALPLTKFKIKQPVLSNTKRDHSSNTLLRDRIFECDKITCSWYLYFPSFFLSFYFDRFVSKYRALENFPQVRANIRVMNKQRVFDNKVFDFLTIFFNSNNGRYLFFSLLKTTIQRQIFKDGKEEICTKKKKKYMEIINSSLTRITYRSGWIWFNIDPKKTIFHLSHESEKKKLSLEIEKKKSYLMNV